MLQRKIKNNQWFLNSPRPVPTQARKGPLKSRETLLISPVIFKLRVSLT
jgi:hypothetical protein